MNTLHEGDTFTLKQQSDGKLIPVKSSSFFSFFSKVQCFIGWHEWTWRATTKEINGMRTLIIDKEIPDHARCSRCKVLYGNGDES